MPAELGHLRLLSGMVGANRPWRAFSGLSSAVVAAFGTGAYALLSTSIWQLSGQLGWPRLGAIMVCAVTAMVAWLIIGHHLWEKAEIGKRRKDATLYNAATALTLGIAVLCGYAAMFVLLYGVAALLIQGGVFKDNAGHAAGIGAYAALAWLGAAIGTVAGALGSRLENIDEIRHATYGHKSVPSSRVDRQRALPRPRRRNGPFAGLAALAPIVPTASSGPNADSAHS